MDRLLRLQHGGRLASLSQCIRLVFIQHSGFGVVMPLLIENVLQLVLYRRVPDGAQHFHAVVDVTSHQVRRPQQILRLSAVVEDIHPGVLKVSIDNTDRLDVVRHAANPG